MAGWLLAGALGLGPARAQSWQRAQALTPASGGFNEEVTVSALVADGAGGYWLGGSFAGTLALGSFTLTAQAGSDDAFVAHVDAAGAYLLAARAGGPYADAVAALALDAAGQVTVAGQFSSPSITFGSFTLPNNGASATPSGDVFVARLSAAGQWTQAAGGGGASDDQATALALDPDGSAVVTGAYQGSSATFGSYTLAGGTSPSGGTPFVVRLGSAGAWTQAVRVQSTGAPVALTTVAVDAGGTAVVGGIFFGGGTITLGSYSLSSASGNNLLLARLSRGGTWTQAVQSTGAGTTIARYLALDAASNAVVAGETNGASTTFGAYSVACPPSATGQRIFTSFVAGLSAAGTWTRAVQPTGSFDNSTGGLGRDAAGNVWLAGSFASPTITFGSTTLANSDPNASQNATADLYVAQLSSAGAWKLIGWAARAMPRGLALGGGRLAVAGRFRGSAAFGSFGLSTGPSYAGFLAVLGGGILAAPAAAVAPARLAPNPATGQATLWLPAVPAARPVTLLDALGREVRRFSLPAQAAALPLDLGGLPAGAYLVRCGPAAARLLVE